MEYYKDLCKRFVSDYKLPIPLIDEPYFSYFLNVYEKDHGALTNYNGLCRLVDDKFGGNPHRFLDEYYLVRDKIITTVESSDAYKKFNQIDLRQYGFSKPDVSKNSVYNCENIGKCFLSIDLKKANFQTLRYIDPDIVLGADSYEDFIGKFTDMRYVSESKYTRQVIFGKLNPSRQITVEKYLTYQMWLTFSKKYPEYSKLKSMSNDEIVIELDSTDGVIVSDIENLIYSELGLKVSAECYALSGIYLVRKRNNEKRQTYFVKTNAFDASDRELVCVPLQYHAIVHKLFNGLELSEYDYHFDYEGLDCRFNEEFELMPL